MEAKFHGAVRPRTHSGSCASPPTPWHHQFFHAVTFEPQRLTKDSATAVPSDSLRHCILQSAFRQLWKEYGVTITGATSLVCS